MVRPPIAAGAPFAPMPTESTPTRTRPSATSGAASVVGMTHATQWSGRARPMNTSRSAAIAERQTSTRASAPARRSASATPAAATIGIVASSDTEYTPVTACALSACTSTPGAMIIAGFWRARGSFALGAEPFDDAGERGPFVGREWPVGLVEQRGDGRGARAVEECSYEMSNSGTLGDAARRGGVIDVARALFFVPEMALLLEDAEQRAHRGGARRIGDLIVDLGRRRVTAAVDDVHDLP